MAPLPEGSACRMLTACAAAIAGAANYKADTRADAPFTRKGSSLYKNVTYAGNHWGMPCTVGQSQLVQFTVRLMHDTAHSSGTLSAEHYWQQSTGRCEITARCTEGSSSQFQNVKIFSETSVLQWKSTQLRNTWEQRNTRFDIGKMCVKLLHTVSADVCGRPAWR